MICIRKLNPHERSIGLKKSLKRRVFEKVKTLVLNNPGLMSFSSYLLNYFPTIKLRLKQKMDTDLKLESVPMIKPTTEESLRIQALEKIVQRTIQDIRNEQVS